MLGLPFIGTFTVPTLAIGLIIVFLIFFRRTFDQESPLLCENADRTIIDKSKPISPTSEAKVDPNEGACNGACQCGKSSGCCVEQNGIQEIKRLCVVYGTTTGNAKSFAFDLAEAAKKDGLKVEVNDVKDIEPEDKIPLESQRTDTVFIVIISTYTEGTAPETAEWFFKWLEEAAKDFR